MHPACFYIGLYLLADTVSSEGKVVVSKLVKDLNIFWIIVGGRGNYPFYRLMKGQKP